MDSIKMESYAPEVAETYSAVETEKRRDQVVKRMLNTPPQPHPKPGCPIAS